MIRSLIREIGSSTRVGRSITRTLATSGVLQNHDKYLETSTKDGVKTITLSHAASRNSLSLEMMKTLINDIEKDDTDVTLRSILIRASPGKVFSAGHNLKELASTTEKDLQRHEEVFFTAENLMRTIRQSSVPIIAVVDGLAAAAGCQLVAACDMAICTENSSFSTPGANFGIFCSTPGVALVRNVPRKVAAHMLFTGLPISAQEALRVGLVSKVVAPNELEDEIKKITSSINLKSRSVITVGKKFFYEQLDTDIATAYTLGSEVMVGNLKLKDGQEGVKSFMEKRKPVWTHEYTTNE